MMPRDSSTDAVEHLALALAPVLAVLRGLRRKSAIKVRGGRARARSAGRDARGRFIRA
jgi:hypothetical protein